MPKCILCNQIKGDSEFTEEHIVLMSLGGKKSFKCVCKDCNSSFGKSIDKIASDTLVGIRYLLKISGRNKVPNPYLNTETYFPMEFPDRPGQITNVKVQIKTNEDGELTECSAIPNVYDYAEGKLIVCNNKTYPSYVKSKLKDLHDKDLIKSEDLPPINEFIIKKPIPLFYPLKKEELDNLELRCYPLALKMAYEYFCIVSKMEYLDDDLAEPIREFLKKFDEKNTHFNPTEASYDRQYEKMEEQEWQEWMNLPDHDIIINIKNEKNKIIANVDLFHFFNYTITISEDFSKYTKLDETLYNKIMFNTDSVSRTLSTFKFDIIPVYVSLKS